MKENTTKIRISDDDSLTIWTGENEADREVIYIMNDRSRNLVAIDDPVAALKLVDDLTMRAASIVAQRGHQ